MSGAVVRQVGGYVLAGGKSSRMGTDKALVEMAGKPLIAWAVERLRQICSDVHILSSNPTLEVYAPLVRDLHSDCGPIGGIEAALAHTSFEWNLLLPVDVPFAPAEFLRDWVERVTGQANVHAAYFDLDGKPQPSLLLIRRETLPSIRASIASERYKLVPAITAATEGMLWVETLGAAVAEQWFVNLNTPDDLEEARRRAEVLERSPHGRSRVVHHKS